MNRTPNSLPLIVTFAVLSAFVFLNVDGYQLHLISPWGGVGEITGEPPFVNWAHGWPVCFAIRSSIYSVSAGQGVKVQSFTGEHSFYSRWPIDESPVAAFSVFAATCDLLFCVIFLIGTFVGTRKISVKLGLQFQFGMRSLLACMLICAVLLAARDWVFASRFVLEAFAILATVFGGAMCWLAIPWPKRMTTSPRQQKPIEP